MNIPHHRLPCGCSTDGIPCDQHRRKDAPDLAAAISLALFLAMIAAWSAILS